MTDRGTAKTLPRVDVRRIARAIENAASRQVLQCRDVDTTSPTCNELTEGRLPAPVSQRVRKRREALRAAGLRPIQIWVPDTRRPGFAEECRRQSLAVAAAVAADRDLRSFIDAALADADDETET